MSYPPSSALVSKVKGFILATFEIAEQEAAVHAGRMAALAADCGGDDAAQLPWDYLVKQDLGQKLRWRSESNRKEFYAQKEEWYKTYDFLFGSPPRA